MKKYTMNGRISFFLIIFIILCISTFSLLSAISAVNTKKATELSVTHRSYYYTLTNNVQDRLKEIDDQLYSFYKSTSSKKDYFKKLSSLKGDYEINDHTISFTDSYRDLKISVKLEALYPGNKFYKITKWAIVSTNTPDNAGKMKTHSDDDDDGSESGTIEIWGEQN